MMEDRLPLDILREKYIPISEYPTRYGICVATVLDLYNKGKINRAEFVKPGDSKRSLHFNYEEVLSALGRDINESHIGS